MLAHPCAPVAPSPSSADIPGARSAIAEIHRRWCGCCRRPVTPPTAVRSSAGPGDFLRECADPLGLVADIRGASRTVHPPISRQGKRSTASTWRTVRPVMRLISSLSTPARWAATIAFWSRAWHGRKRSRIRRALAGAGRSSRERTWQRPPGAAVRSGGSRSDARQWWW
jgi:hypothetical protein